MIVSNCFTERRWREKRQTVKNGVEFHARADSSDSSVEGRTGRMPEAFPPLRLQVCLGVLFSESKMYI